MNLLATVFTVLPRRFPAGLAILTVLTVLAVLATVFTILPRRFPVGLATVTLTSSHGRHAILRQAIRGQRRNTIHRVREEAAHHWEHTVVSAHHRHLTVSASGFPRCFPR